eukprot:3248222-Rhodomonas_salina.3
MSCPVLRSQLVLALLGVVAGAACHHGGRERAFAQAQGHQGSAAVPGLRGIMVYVLCGFGHVHPILCDVRH